MINPPTDVQNVESNFPLPEVRKASDASGWFALARHPSTVRRALLTASIVGVTLIAINHGEAILSGTVTRGRIFQMCLTVFVPYIVSTTSSVATRREMAAARERDLSSC